VTAKLGLRAKLTIIVTLVFATAIIVVAVLVVDVVQSRLVSDTRDNAEAVLADYLDSVYGGTVTFGVVDPTEATRFFYRDVDGNTLDPAEYFQAVSTGYVSFPGQPLIGDQPPDFEGLGEASPVDVGPSTATYGSIGMTTASSVGDLMFGAVGPVHVDATTGELLDADGDTVPFAIVPTPVAEPRSVDLGDRVVAVAQSLELGDGAIIDVGVSSPLQPVNDSLDTIKQALWVVVPLLVASMAAVTWLASGRALRPVDDITTRVRAISASNISERVPVPGGSDQIQRLAVTMNDTLSRLDRSQQRQRQLVADASHELRSPVAASRAQLEVALANPEDADWTVVSNTVLAEQEVLACLIDDLLALSRLDESTHMTRDEIDLDDLVAAEAARTRRLPVKVTIDGPVRVRANAGHVTRAVRNLIDNAAAHAIDAVELTLEVSDGVSRIIVDDDGPGVPTVDRERVFDRFTRLDEARDRQRGGSGLGLAIAREVARSHDGDVIATDGPLGGARFVLSLPIPGSTPESVDRIHATG
ncbi:MAG: HAMP domain-containing histidine kinase, partial [Actinomycetia bacterium]|nr:HAMP domain-containing histidine kinase [Actinomycetes bacterium]